MDKVVWWGVKVRGRWRRHKGRRRIHLGGGFFFMQSTRGDFGSFETELEQWDLQCTPGLRGFGLGGLGRP
jgi:hypothetical protein